MIAISRRFAVIGALGTTALATTPVTTAWAGERRLRIREIYGYTADFSDTALSLQGQRVEVPGFMAPPLKPKAAFFVLTKLPMAVCPFCDTEADWPNDIIMVKTRDDNEWVPFNRPILTTGVLELGPKFDSETGFLSMVRLVDAEYRVF